MKRIVKTIIERKNNLIEQLNSKTEEERSKEESIKMQVLKDAYVIYLPENFELKYFIEKLKDFLHNQLKFETNTAKVEKDFFRIEYSKAKGLGNTLGINETYHLYLMNKDDRLFVYIESSDEDRNFAVNLLAKLSSSEEADIVNFCENYIADKLREQIEYAIPEYENVLVEDINLNFKIWFVNVLDDDEILLSKLGIHECKDLPVLAPEDTVEELFFLQTQKDSYIAGFDKQREAVFFENLEGKMEYSKGMVRYTISCAGLKWTSKRSNAKLFALADQIHAKQNSAKIFEAARINKINDSIEGSIRLLKHYYSQSRDSYADFLLAYLEFSRNKAELKKAEPALRQIIENLNGGDKFLKTVNAWELPEADKAMLADIMVNLAREREQKAQLYEFYTAVRKDFLSQNKDLFALTLFDTVYSEFLIDAGKPDEAVKILEKRLKKLPDESISDLLPEPETDLTGDQSGQLLKVKVFELLAKAGEKPKEQKLKIARLQPLNKKRLDPLRQAEQKDERAEHLFELLYSPIEPKSAEIPQPQQPKEKVFNKQLRHPFTTKGGSFYSLQKWLSKLNSDNYDTVKNYTEKLDNEKYPSVFSDLNKIKHAFSLPDLEAYVARGDKSKEVIAYEGNPPFVIIGADFIEAENRAKLNPAELRFALASEAAHVFFKHTRITSTDVWRGAADKGYLFLDTLIHLIPLAGLVGKAVQNVGEVHKLSKIFKISDKMKSAGDVFAGAISLAGFYKKISKNKTKDRDRQNLLAASRLMQYTADRAGLLFAGSMSDSVSALIKTNKKYSKSAEEIKQGALHNYLLKSGDNGHLKNQEFALRIAALASFYLSDEYLLLQKELFSEKKK